MVRSITLNGQLFSESGECTNTQFYGKDCLREDISNILDTRYIGCDCTTSKNEYGVIIGYEINDEYADEYYIVFIPGKNKVTYELATNKEFCNSIKIIEDEGDKGKYSISM